MARMGSIVCIILILSTTLCECNNNICDRRPLGTKTEPLPPDNRFKIDIVGINDDQYIPQRQYTVRLYSTDSTSTFIAFTIAAREDTKPNEKNPRKPILLDAGSIRVSPEFPSKPSPNCKNSVIQSDITPKTFVEAIWLAPPKDNKCVTIYAVLAVKEDVWYNFEGPLSKRVCEDRRNAEDMQPAVNDDCRVCEDARYMVMFDGIWSYNTHPYMFPESRSLARFSDVVGASHSNRYSVYQFNSDASAGLQMLAEQGNTTELEIAIQSQLGSSVRTIIKAASQPQPNMATVATFRVTKVHHLVSLVTAILPSPDWFLGVSNMELCDAITNRWAPNLTLNLYPLDAGTDSGLTFEAPNEETMPPQPISSAPINKDIPKEQMRPFAKLKFELIRTYQTPDCSTESPVDLNLEDSKDDDKDTNEYVAPTTQEAEEVTISIAPGSSPDCPITEWEEWLPCEGECENNRLKGFQSRFRYHIVDGVPVGKYVENGPKMEDKEISPYCLENYPDSETQECEESCDEEEETVAQRRIW
ncbi:spondin-1-like [Leptidea sinapis]|uniref:spondin-1-like n=1 Tax=Leptidea sinapis TaxID=189913 RepID=UPI002126168D|nr:spondin-1-like [Leptidea sinapis]